MLDDRISERRTGARSRQLKAGSIVFNGGKQAGLCLMVSPLGVPAAFELLTGGERRRCTVVWRLPDRIGIKYQ